MTMPKETLPNPDALPNPRWDEQQPPLPTATELLEQAAEAIAPPQVQAKKLWNQMVGAESYFLLQQFNHRQEMNQKIKQYLTLIGETDLNVIRVQAVYDKVQRDAHRITS